MLRSLVEKFVSKMLLAPGAVTADVATTGMDLQQLSNFAFEVIVGAFTFSGTNKIDLEVEHSDDNSGWSAVAEEDLYSTEGGNVAKSLDAAGDASKTHLIGYRGNKRYVRLNLNVSGTVNAPVAVNGVSTLPQVQPKV